MCDAFLLVGPNLVVKIADFGLARGVHDKNYYRVAGKQLLPVRSMSPESLLFGVFSTAGDVWYRIMCDWHIYLQPHKSSAKGNVYKLCHSVSTVQVLWSIAMGDCDIW